MGRTACTELQCRYKGALYLYLYLCIINDFFIKIPFISYFCPFLFQISVSQPVDGNLNIHLGRVNHAVTRIHVKWYSPKQIFISILCLVRVNFKIIL